MNFDWKFFITILAAVAGLAVPVLLWQFDLQAKSLTVRLVSSTPLQSNSTNSIPDLQILIDGELIDNPVISILEIANDGSKPIPTSDFESDIELQVDNASKIVRARVTMVEPEDLKATASLVEQSVRLKPLLLNPNDKVTVSVLTSGAIPEFSPRARIAAVPSIKFDDHKGMIGRWQGIALNGLTSLTGLILYFYFSTKFLFSSGWRIPKVLGVVLLLNLAVSSGLSVRRVYEIAEIPREFENIFPIMIVVAVIACVAFMLAVRGRYSSDSRSG